MFSMSASDHFRSNEVSEKYRAHRDTGALEKSCPLCDTTAVIGYRSWKIIPNEFPYDLIAVVHDMIVPLRHVDEAGLTDEERAELIEIKNSTLGTYDIVVEATRHNKSIPAHFHLHLIKAKSGLGRT
jgi:hypothetical protein